MLEGHQIRVIGRRYLVFDDASSGGHAEKDEQYTKRDPAIRDRVRTPPLMTRTIGPSLEKSQGPGQAGQAEDDGTPPDYALLRRRVMDPIARESRATQRPRGVHGPEVAATSARW